MEQLQKDRNNPEVIDLEELKEFISNSSDDTAVYVGCDSKRYKKRGKRKVVYVTVVVVHYDGCKGARVFRQIKIDDDHGQIQTRLLQEVWCAVEMALEISPAVGDREFQVHLDLNPNPEHKSSVVVKQATGMVLGMLGFQPKLKPESMASSACADRWTVIETGKRQDRRRDRKKFKKRKRA